MVKKIRGVSFEENENNAMGLSFYNLSHRFGYQSPNWPYFEDVKIERIQYMAKSGVLSQRITTSMHNTTHIDAPAHASRALLRVTAPIARRSQRLTASPKRSAANSALAASPSMRWGRQFSTRR